MVQVNPEVLVWARETAGLSPDGAARKLGFHTSPKSSATEKLSALEEGRKEPSRVQLNKMADTYRRPLITLYLNQPPPKAERGVDFRRARADATPDAEARVDALVRDIRARQSMLRAALEDDEDVEPLSFIGSLRADAEVQEAEESLTSLLEMTHSAFYAATNADAAFVLLRRRVESLGVYVILKGNLRTYRTAFSTKDFRGFSLADVIAPFIVINDQDSHSAWAFTLLHELVHLLRGESGIGNSDTSSQTEKFCERAAGSYLLPDSELQVLQLGAGTSNEQKMQLIANFARERHLSRLMVAYNALQVGIIDNQEYAELDAAIRTRLEQDKEQQTAKLREHEGGPNPYIVRRHRLGSPLLDAVRLGLANETLSTTRAARILDVKPTQVQTLLAR